MTLKQFLENADSREIGLWLALNKIEAEEHAQTTRNQNLLTKAANARRR
jgi:hypothetical protein